MIAAEYPFLDVMWTTFVVFLWFICNDERLRQPDKAGASVVSGLPLHRLKRVLPTVTRL